MFEKVFKKNKVHFKVRSDLASAFGVNQNVYLEVDSEVEGRAIFKVYFREVSIFKVFFQKRPVGGRQRGSLRKIKFKVRSDASAFGVNEEVYLEVDSEVEGRSMFQSVYFREVSFFQKDTCSKCLSSENYRQNGQSVFLRKRPVGLYRNMGQSIFLKKRRFEPVSCRFNQDEPVSCPFEMGLLLQERCISTMSYPLKDTFIRISIRPTGPPTGPDFGPVYLRPETRKKT